MRCCDAPPFFLALAAFIKLNAVSTLRAVVADQPSRSAGSAPANSDTDRKPLSARKSAAQARAARGALGHKPANSLRNDILRSFSETGARGLLLAPGRATRAEKRAHYIVTGAAPLALPALTVVSPARRAPAGGLHFKC